MRGLSIKKILVFCLITLNIALMSGCSVFEADGNESKYITVPYDICPLDGFGTE